MSATRSPDGPPAYRWLCLDHVREFNAGYDYFSGMSADQIIAAQSPNAGKEPPVSGGQTLIRAENCQPGWACGYGWRPHRF